MKTFINIMLAVVLTFGISGTFAQSKKTSKTATFSVNMHCGSCVKNIEKTIPFEKGVKDISVSLEKKQVTVDYDSSKTSTDALIKAFKAIKLDAKLLEEKAK